ncbi:MAG: proton-conducting transporter membrane subunit [Saprospiraceae bacterium]
MNQFLPYFILLPLVGLVLCALAPKRKETLLFGIAITTVALHILGIGTFSILWILDGCPALFYEGPTLYQTHDSHFAIDFYFDGITAVYGAVASVLTFLVMIFSRYYMHRDGGFKRFFSNVLFFYWGLNIVLFSGNFETMFIGWEILGVTSFFLIAYYRDRYLPIKNALKVVSLYRVADVALLISIWLVHHAFERNITFADLLDTQMLSAQFAAQPIYPILISGIFLLAAMVKSAQMPFSSWLPRAMEGPTTSSAIFYGSLSVHIGVFLLLRTFPIWEGSEIFRGIVIAVGLLTSIMATLTARVQSTVKTQIAYSSIAQIGLMFMEVALGWHTLALIHFAGNAFLRSYQLLVSPSVLSYLIHDQFFNFIPPQHHISNSFWGKLKLSIYVLSIKEWNFDTLMYRFLWSPLKQAGRALGFISVNWVAFVFAPIFFAGLYLVYNREIVSPAVMDYLPSVMAVFGILVGLKAFAERGKAQVNWLFVIMNQLFSALSIGLNEEFEHGQVLLFLSGIVVSGAVGFWCIRRLERSGESVKLDRFQGHSYFHPRLAFVFVLACLGLSGFPITPTFIGEDLLLGNIEDHQFSLLALTALSLILDGLAVFRIYARLFLGPNEKGYHEVAFRSS